jgi:capsular polysaccharide biosynthesis protein
MELRRYLAILRRRLALIVVTVAVAVGAAWAATPRTTPYVATSVVYVGPRSLNFNQNTAANNNDAILAANAVLATFAKMIDSRPTAADAVSRTGVSESADEVVGETVVAPDPNTQLLDVKVTDSNPANAMRLANGLADAFVYRIQSQEAGQPANPGAPADTPTSVFERAALPSSPQPTGLARNLGLGALLGLLGSAGIAFLLEYLDVTVKGAGDAERQLKLPVLGVIPFERSV